MYQIHFDALSLFLILYIMLQAFIPCIIMAGRFHGFGLKELLIYLVFCCLLFLLLPIYIIIKEKKEKEEDSDED